MRLYIIWNTELESFEKKKINTGNSSVSVKTMKFRKWYGDFLFAKSAA